MDFKSLFAVDFDVMPIIKTERWRHPEDVEEALCITYLKILHRSAPSTYRLYFEGETLDAYFSDVYLYDEDYDAIEQYTHYNKYAIEQQMNFIRGLYADKVIGLNIHSIGLYSGRIRMVFNYII